MVETIGIIAEGPGDQEILAHIIRGAIGLDRAQLRFLRPEYDNDETDLASHAMPVAAKRGGYVFVIEDCKNHAKLAAFLEVVEEERAVVIHLDAAEADRAEFNIGPRTEPVRDHLVQCIQTWTRADHHQHCRYAIAVMETEAWILALYEESRTDKVRDPKDRLHKVIGPKRIRGFAKLFQLSERDRASELGKEFRKAKRLQEACKKNESLRLFYESLLNMP